MKTTRLKSIEIFIGMLYLFCLVVAYIGFTQYFNQTGEIVSFWNKLYLILQLFVINFSQETVNLPILLNIARFLAPLLLAGTILNLFFSTLIIRINLLIIRFGFKNHIIFCGFGNKTNLLINDYLKVQNKNIVVIEKNQENLYLNRFKNSRVRFIVGNAEDPDILKKANITNASTIFALTENDKTNINITRNAIEIFSRKNIQKPIKIILHISDFYNMSIFKELQEKNINNIDFHAFNIFHKIASNVVGCYCPDRLIELNNENDPSCHILVHGLNNIGEYIIYESIQLYHFGNLKPLKITIVDSHIDEAAAYFNLKFPQIDKIVRIDFKKDLDIYKNQEMEVLDGISLCFICCETQSQSYETAKIYRQMFFKLHLKKMPGLNTRKNISAKYLETPVIVVLSQKDPGVLDLFENVGSVSNFLNIRKCAFYAHVCNKRMIADDEEIIDNIAMQNHNLYLKLQEAELKKVWEQLTEIEKDSNRYAARHLEIKLRYLGISLIDINEQGEIVDLKSIEKEKLLVLSKMEHNRWIAEKLLAGFTDVDEIMDNDLQTELKNKLRLHKDIKSWEELSDSDQFKDDMLIQNIESIVAGIGKKLVKIKA